MLLSTHMLKLVAFMWLQRAISLLPHSRQRLESLSPFIAGYCYGSFVGLIFCTVFVHDNRHILSLCRSGVPSPNQLGCYEIMQSLPCMRYFYCRCLCCLAY
ncbi:hypothetical protein E2542_SST22804 [Spatholobus suberectus]|nr:hypothetical protein E2542_SST22804 [Spatholobus suberectus]